MNALPLHGPQQVAYPEKAFGYNKNCDWMCHTALGMDSEVAFVNNELLLLRVTLLCSCWLS